MRTLYFDCFSGAGGDMLVGALIDAGVNIDELRAGLAGLAVDGFNVTAEPIRKQGFAATKFDVELTEKDASHRGLSQIKKLLTQSKLPARVRDRAIATFERLAAAEAEAHGMDIERVHFHEVGAIDAIVDIVGVMLGLEALAVEQIVVSPLAVGGGTVKCAHGVMPVPAPATALLIRGVPIAESTEMHELLTPTAAAILTTLANSFGPLPGMRIDRVGLGAGTRDNQDRPNVVRVMLGDALDESRDDTVAVLETNLDDASGEWIGHCLARLLEKGALDAFLTPIYMKKNRPGVILTVVCDPLRMREFEAMIFAETPTFGIRHHLCRRACLQRRQVEVETRYGAIRMKLGYRDDRLISAAPEYDDCVAAAKHHDVALRTIMDEAEVAWRRSATD